MPDEADPHKRTWMSFGASRAIWTAAELPVVQDNLAGIANAITEFEPLKMLVRAEELALARSKCSPRVEFVTTTMNDFWMRDSGPVFRVNGVGGLDAVGPTSTVGAASSVFRRIDVSPSESPATPACSVRAPR